MFGTYLSHISPIRIAENSLRTYGIILKTAHPRAAAFIEIVEERQCLLVSFYLAVTVSVPNLSTEVEHIIMFFVQRPELSCTQSCLIVLNIGAGNRSLDPKLLPVSERRKESFIKIISHPVKRQIENIKIQTVVCICIFIINLPKFLDLCI